MAGILDQDVMYLKGVGPQRAAILTDELGIKTLADLIYYFPYRYVDRTQFSTINSLHEDSGWVQLQGRITKIELNGIGRKQRLVAWFVDNTASIQLVWFQGIKWIREQLHINVEYVVFGKPNEFNHSISFVHPEIEELSKYRAKPAVVLQPMYNTSEKMKNKMMKIIMKKMKMIVKKMVMRIIMKMMKINKIYHDITNNYIIKNNNNIKNQNILIFFNIL